MDALPESLTTLLERARQKQIFKNQIIFYEGDVTLDVLILKSGIVKIHDIDEQGNEKVLHLLKQPAIFPFAFFTASDVATRWFYTALTDCEVYVISKEQLSDMLASESQLVLYMLHWFSREVHEIMTRLNSLGKTLARDKVLAALRFLLACHSLERRSGWRRVTFPVNHQLLADMTGITRESATLTMKELVAERIVRFPRMTILEINQSRLFEDK